MITTTHQKGKTVIGIVSSATSIQSVQDALDLIATANHVHGCDALIIEKQSLPEDFFDLTSGIAGELLQKFTNYNMQVAITGDFSEYKSRALTDFIRECNRGHHIYFVANADEGIEKIS